MIGSAFRAIAPALRATLLALAIGAGSVAPARGGGPLEVFSHQPVVYANGGAALKLNVDQGTLGTRTNAQATALVQNAIALWNGVATSTLRISLGPALSTDYTAANYSGILNNFNDGLNPVIFDTNGAITDALFGVGAKNYVIGFAGSAYWTSGAQAGKYAEGRAVLNGSINLSDAVWTIALAHEFGHFFGLDHTQLDSAQGLAGSNYPVMYPIAYRTALSLHEDDTAAVSALYPASGAASAYGQLTGTFTTAGGTPILGANIWARETSTSKLYSVVSDFLTQGSGYFRLHVPPGIYTLHAESIESDFYGGSGVGPYSSTPTDVSFQSPHPINAVTLGGALPRQIAIVGGCVATASFRQDGTGNVTGNCVAPPAAVTALQSSANPSLGSSVTFTAQVTGTSPSGTVAFTDNGSTIAGCGAVPLTGSGNSRSAQCAASGLGTGVHPITATYSGDASNGASAANLSQLIVAVTTTYTVRVANNGPNEVTGAIVSAPAPTGLSIGAWTCAVTAAGSGGSVTTACGAASGIGALNTTANLKVGGVVTYTIAATATLVGNVTYAASVKAPQGTTNSGTSCTTMTGSLARSFDAATGTCSASDTDPVTP
jgi:uncharacterized repeat protein (TIGR01451 family)